MELLQREPPPPLEERYVRPNTELDRLILRVMVEALEQRSRVEWTPHQLVSATGALNKDVWRRLGLMAQRGLVKRNQVPFGPRRGPGSFTYSVTPPTRSDTTIES